MDIERLILFAGGIWKKREEIDPRLSEICQFIFPERNGFGQRQRTEGREAIFDATPEEANATLAAALHSLLTNPASSWFALDIVGDNTAKEAARNWIVEVERRMLDVFSDPSTGFSNEVSAFYLDLAPFGWAVFFSEDEAGKPIRFRCIPPFECAVAENREGRIDKLVRRYEMDALDALNAFGADTVSDEVKGKAEREHREMVKISHIVMPVDEVPGGYEVTDSLANGNNHKYASIYFEPDTKTLLHQGGYFEFPYQVPRWSKASGDVYGRGPGWQALPDVRVLNKVSESQLEGAEQQANPALLVPDDGVLGKIRTFAGGVTYYRPERGEIRPLPAATDLSTMQSIREEKQDAIRRAFLNDRILMAGGPQMTATEVVSRENKQMLVLGPVLGRLQGEFLGPLVERVFSIMLRRGMLDEIPQELEGMEIRVRYVSPIARAQKQVDASAFMQAVQFFAPIIQMNPGVTDNFNHDAIVRDSQELFGYPAKYLRSGKEVEQMRQERAKAEQVAAESQMQMQMLAEAAKAAPKVVQGQGGVAA